MTAFPSVPACPDEAPFYNGQQCVACYLPRYWNLDTKECEACEKGTFYDITEMECVVCHEGFKYDKATYRCVRTTAFPSVPSCPDEAPFYNGKECVSCYLPKYWNYDTSTCETCPQPQHYDITLKQCATCEEGYRFDIKSYGCVKIVCPDDAPFYNGQKCVACYLPKYWNLDTRACEECAANLHYDIVQKKCVGCGEKERFDEESYECVEVVCEGLTPFWNGKECVECFLPWFWNEDTLTCDSCPEGQNYDIGQKECVACPDGYDEELFACVKVQTVTPKTAVESTEVPECPSSAPFWDGNKCVACYLPKYWNYSTRTCNNCPSGTNYDIVMKKCRSCPEGQAFDFSTFTCK